MMICDDDLWWCLRVQSLSSLFGSTDRPHKAQDCTYVCMWITKSKSRDDVQAGVMNNRNNATVHCCAECGKDDGDVSLKACGACMRVRYCNAVCQKSHWLKHKIECRQRAAELYDEALFKDPPTKEDCSICFLSMPVKLISCMTLPPATITSVPMYDFAIANEILTPLDTEHYYFCCG